jgi:hypothetical protein
MFKPIFVTFGSIGTWFEDPGKQSGCPLGSLSKKYFVSSVIE